MTTQVKWYSSALHVGMTTGSGSVANTVRSNLLAAVVNGMNTNTPTTITRSGAVATVTTPTAHGFLDKQVIVVSGCAETEYNVEAVLTYLTTTTFSYPVSGTPATPATGSPSVKTAPLGWAESFTGTNKSVFRSNNGASSQHYFRVNDPATQTLVRGPTGSVISVAGEKFVDFRIFSTMSDVDTGTLLGYVMMHRASSGQSPTGLHTLVIGDDKSCYVLMQDAEYTGSYLMNFMGDYKTFVPGSYEKPSMVLGKYGWAGSDAGTTSLFSGTQLGLGGTTTSPNLVFGNTGFANGGDIRGVLSGQSTSGLIAGAGETLEGPYYPWPVYCQFSQAPAHIKGQMPGLYHFGASPTPTFPGRIRVCTDMITVNGTARTILMVPVSTSSSTVLYGFDITGPW